MIAPEAEIFRESFRGFALGFYAAPEVEAALLRLQDEEGWDAVLALYGLWRAHRRERIAPAEARKAADLAAEWSARVVRPLREIRRGMKAGFAHWSAEEAEAARREVKALELAMEMRLIARLEALPAPPEDPAGQGSDALANLQALGEASGRKTPPEALIPLAKLRLGWSEAPEGASQRGLRS